MIRCLRTTRSARSRPVSVNSASFFLAALDQAVGTRRFSIRAGGRARDVQHLGDARGKGRRAGAVRHVLADREGEEVDGVSRVLVSPSEAGVRSMWLYCRQAYV